VLLAEWRWALPGRNTTPCGTPGHTCDLHRQNDLLDHYTAAGTATIIWDTDRQLPAGDPLRGLRNVAICEPAMLPASGARRLLHPLPDAALGAADPDALAAACRELPLAYAGNQYDRDEQFGQFFAPAAVGQWTKRASQADLARLRVPWDPVTGQYRAPDEKTIRVVLDRLDPRALTRALLGRRPRRQRRPGTPLSAGVRDYRARRAAQEARTLARDRLRAVAVDGRPPAEPAAPMAPGSISSASPNTAGGSWTTSRSTSSTTRPAISPLSWNPWTWTAPW
jgi:hypothetical protein